MYMKFGKIKGDGKGAHQGWIELDSVTFPVSGTGSVSPHGEGSAQSRDVHVSKSEDQASVPLWQASVRGEEADVTIDFTKQDRGGETVYLRVEMKGVLITGFSMSGQSRPMTESLSLTATAITSTTTVAPPAPSPKAAP